jgi:hypothetical protein
LLPYCPNSQCGCCCCWQPIGPPSCIEQREGLQQTHSQPEGAPTPQLHHPLVYCRGKTRAVQVCTAVPQHQAPVVLHMQHNTTQHSRGCGFYCLLRPAKHARDAHTHPPTHTNFVTSVTPVVSPQCHAGGSGVWSSSLSCTHTGACQATNPLLRPHKFTLAKCLALLLVASKPPHKGVLAVHTPAVHTCVVCSGRGAGVPPLPPHHILPDTDTQTTAAHFGEYIPSAAKVGRGGEPPAG